MKFLIIILTITFSNTSCVGQKKSNQQNNSVIMTQDLDTFDIKTFNENKINNQYTFTKPNGDIVIQEYRDNYYYQETNIKDDIIDTYKAFYISGKFKDKGSFYERIPVGKYIKYNEKGEIIEERDFDKYYKFTLEDVIKYCKEKDLVEKDVPGSNKKTKVTLTRTDSSNLTENDSIQWNIMYGPVTYTPKGSTQVFGAVLLYVLDGKTGKEVARKYKRIKIDNEWQLVED